MINLDFVHSLLRFSWYQNCITPTALGSSRTTTTTATTSVATTTTTASTHLPTSTSSKHADVHVHIHAYDHLRDSDNKMRPLELLAQEVVQQFASPCEHRRMIAMSTRLRAEYYEKMQSDAACMLPSFCHTLPSGQESGTFVALDVGGSTFRVALVKLTPRRITFGPRGEIIKDPEAGVKIKRMSVSRIDEKVRRLASADFFDWMAQKIQVMLSEDPDMPCDMNHVVPLGMAWSFPIEQTSNRRGLVQGMGKGFACSKEAVGKDLGGLIEAACEKRGFKVCVDALINDSSAVLLSQAYEHPATTMGVIVGTGTNAAAFLPVSCIGKPKFGTRHQSWFDHAERVITNTELSMFGKGILPETRWDELLNMNHALPNFQPLEYMTTGRYLGEILRLIISEAVESSNLFDGQLPSSLQEQYSLDTALLAMIEADKSHNLSASAKELQASLSLPRTPSAFEMAFLRTVTEAISRRAAAYIAVSIHALWALQKDAAINLSTPMGTPKTSIACNGSVILKYPGFKTRCENYIKSLVSVGGADGVFPTEQVVLQPTDEAAIVGAAVAVAMTTDDIEVKMNGDG